MREMRAYAWTHFLAAMSVRSSSASEAANHADAMLAEFDKRFRCATCRGSGHVDQQSCPTCRGSGEADPSS